MKKNYTCPNCKAKLSVDENVTKAKCGVCGKALLLKSKETKITRPEKMETPFTHAPFPQGGSEDVPAAPPSPETPKPVEPKVSFKAQLKDAPKSTIRRYQQRKTGFLDINFNAFVYAGIIKVLWVLAISVFLIAVFGALATSAVGVGMGAPEVPDPVEAGKTLAEFDFEYGDYAEYQTRLYRYEYARDWSPVPLLIAPVVTILFGLIGLVVTRVFLELAIVPFRIYEVLRDMRDNIGMAR